ncbi:integral membrane-like protein [Sphingobium chungbukense]|uniref:integral membrane-like protein n=1 Tax=Sphingobium chungbukense TaxID=56193 RepID=UPI001E2D4EF1|nr:integral membrane-like protein [Sphingobium chungbukense]
MVNKASPASGYGSAGGKVSIIFTIFGDQAAMDETATMARMTTQNSLRQVGPLALMATLLLLPTFLLGPGDSHSVTYNYVWTSQFGTEMAKGNLYPRWLPDSFEGLGSPAFYFYPPIAFWIAGAFDAGGLSTLAAINMAAFLTLLLSGIAMYHWLSARGTYPLAGAILYMAAPYHLMDFYVRGALAEFTAFIWYPLIALAITRLPERRGVILLALAYAGLVLTHLPMAMLTGFFLIAPLGLHRILADRRAFWFLAVSGALAIGLAAFYLLPALTMQGHISSQLLWGPWYRPSSWGLLADGPLLQMLPIPVLIAGLALLSLSARSIWTVISLLAALAALGLIPFLWDIPPFAQAQFPWRLLGLIEFAAITAILSCRPQPILLGLGLALVAFSYVRWTAEAAEYLIKPVPYAMIRRDLPDAVEYLPAGFNTNRITDFERKPNLTEWRDIRPGNEVVAATPGEVTMRRAAFPIWRVMQGDEVVHYKGPVIHFQARRGHYRIERVTIWQEWVGLLVSLASLFLLAVIKPQGGVGPPARFSRVWVDPAN